MNLFLNGAKMLNSLEDIYTYIQISIDLMHCGLIVISGWNSSGCINVLGLKLRLPLVCDWWSGSCEIGRAHV